MNNDPMQSGKYFTIPFRRVFLGALFLPLAMAMAAVSEYREIPLEDKLKDKDLTFCVTFDKMSVNADFAKGDPNSTTLSNLALGLRGIIGFDTKQAFRPEGGEDLRFKVEGNVLPHRGTITMWVCALDYVPADELTGGKKRGNLALLHMMFKQGPRNVEYQLYEYGDTVYFDWLSSEPPHDFGQMGRVQVPRKGIKQKQWHQLVVTYDEHKLAIYLNGVLGAEGFLPEKAAKTLDLQPDPKESFLGIKSPFFEDKHAWGVAVDDVKVYSRVLSPLEISHQYQKLLVNQSAVKLQAFEVKLNGVDEGDGHKLDQIEAEFDFSVLPDADRKQLDAGKLEIAYHLTGPGGFSRAGTWTMQKQTECRRISGIVTPGRYRLETTLKSSGGKTEQNAADVDVPDLSFANNGIGDEDTVPKIWSAFAVDKNRTVTLWNRSYSFGAGPLPTAITVYGRPLLEKAPELVVETSEGKSAIQYRAGKTTRTNRAVTFNGTGKAAGFTLDYATTVEFDGLIKFDFVIKGQPKIKAMRLEWQVKPEYCQYLMTPLLQEKQKAEFAFKYPNNDYDSNTQIWLVAEGKGGFAYSMATDANWVYDPSEPVLKVNKTTGACAVEMITKPVKMPAETPYQALFITTPTRPLPERNRVIRHGDISRADVPHLGMCAGEGLTGGGTFQPHPTDFDEIMKSKLPGTVGVYGMADALTTETPTANYFKKYWDIPGYYIYKMGHKRSLGNGKFQIDSYFTVSACDSTHIKDYLLGNIKELLKHPYADRIWMIYYDLCGDVQCANAEHGCAFKDKFGREVKTFEILSKRKLVERTVRLCQASHRVVMLHNQRLFSPFIHCMADYYFPGEQHNALLIRNPYGYTDELSDAIYRSEYNRDVLGVGVIFLTALGQANVAYLNNPALTEAMLTMLLAHDVEPDQSYAASLPHQKVWDILEKYQVQSSKTRVHLYYNQKSVGSSNPDVRVTYYECPDKQYVLVLANKDISSKETMIDLNGLKTGDYTVREEYVGSDIQVKDGKFAITVPSRSFRLVAFPPKSFYPVTDPCSSPWGNWNSDGAKGSFSVDTDQGHQKNGSLLIQVSSETPDNSSFCFVKKFPVKPGKRYQAAVFIKTQNVASLAKVAMAFQGQDSQGAFLGLPSQSAELTKTGDENWEEVKLDFTIPQKGKWAEACNLVVTLAVQNAKGGKVWFDDFELSESDAP